MTQIYALPNYDWSMFMRIFEKICFFFWCNFDQFCNFWGKSWKNFDITNIKKKKKHWCLLYLHTYLPIYLRTYLWWLLSTSLSNIYLFLKMRISNFKFIFQNVNNYANIYLVLCICNSKLNGFGFSTKFEKYQYN